MILLTAVAVLLVATMVYFVAVSPGQLRSVVDAAGRTIPDSLSEREFTRINSPGWRIRSTS